MKTLIPSPPSCPRCSENRYARERFFGMSGPAARGELVILGRCENCGLRRFMLSDGGVPKLRARPRWVPGRLLRRVRAPGRSALLLAPAGTDIYSVRFVTRWDERFPAEPLDLLWIWLSLEERMDVSAALTRLRGRLKPGGTLRVTAVNAEALSLRLPAFGHAYLECRRQRVLFSPGLLAGFLRDAGFKRGRISYNLVRPVMHAEAVAPE